MYILWCYTGNSLDNYTTVVFTVDPESTLHCGSPRNENVWVAYTGLGGMAPALKQPLPIYIIYMLQLYRISDRLHSEPGAGHY